MKYLELLGGGWRTIRLVRLYRWFCLRNCNVLKSCLGDLNRVYGLSGSGRGLAQAIRKITSKGEGDSKRLQRRTAMCTGHGCVGKKLNAKRILLIYVPVRPLTIAKLPELVFA